MSCSPPSTRTHAVLDLESRRLKAQKIERLLGTPPLVPGARILEIGCGSGGISSYFGTHPAGFLVHAVDIADERVARDGYEFRRVTGVDLPFDDDAFDIVISNHVIEHVGNRQAQAAHLAEIARVLRAAGTGYLAVPNRWALVEPHYRLPLLSWWPEHWRSPYLRLFRRGDEYDCRPLEASRLERMLRRAGFTFTPLGAEAVRTTLELEHASSKAGAVLRRLPPPAWRAAHRLLPTLIYRFRHVAPELPARLDGR
jgi:SAM-dependent methyltransferase